MILIINNLTSNNLSYVNGLVTVAANGSTTLTPEYLYPASRDPGLLSDCVAVNVTLSDSVTTYQNQNAVQYLNTIANSLGGAVVGYIGTSIPSFAITVGGEDPNGNVKIGHFDINSNLMTIDYSTSATGSSVPLDASFTGGQNPSGNLQAFSTDSSGRQYVDLFDSSGNSIASVNSQLKIRDVIDVSAQQQSMTISTTATEALGGDTILSNRKLIAITPTTGIVYWGISNSVTTSVGQPIFPNNTLFLSFTANVPVYLVAPTSTTVIVTEAS